jgi:hypothetical protein
MSATIQDLDKAQPEDENLPVLHPYASIIKMDPEGGQAQKTGFDLCANIAGLTTITKSDGYIPTHGLNLPNIVIPANFEPETMSTRLIDADHIDIEAGDPHNPTLIVIHRDGYESTLKVKPEELLKAMAEYTQIVIARKQAVAENPPEPVIVLPIRATEYINNLPHEDKQVLLNFGISIPGDTDGIKDALTYYFHFGKRVSTLMADYYRTPSMDSTLNFWGRMGRLISGQLTENSGNDAVSTILPPTFSIQEAGFREIIQNEDWVRLEEIQEEYRQWFMELYKLLTRDTDQKEALTETTSDEEEKEFQGRNFTVERIYSQRGLPIEEVFTENGDDNIYFTTRTVRGQSLSVIDSEGKSKVIGTLPSEEKIIAVTKINGEMAVITESGNFYYPYNERKNQIFLNSQNSTLRYSFTKLFEVTQEDGSSEKYLAICATGNRLSGGYPSLQEAMFVMPLRDISRIEDYAKTMFRKPQSYISLYNADGLDVTELGGPFFAFGRRTYRNTVHKVNRDSSVSEVRTHENIYRFTDNGSVASNHTVVAFEGKVKDRNTANPQTEIQLYRVAEINRFLKGLIIAKDTDADVYQIAISKTHLAYANTKQELDPTQIEIVIVDLEELVAGNDQNTFLDMTYPGVLHSIAVRVDFDKLPPGNIAPSFIGDKREPRLFVSKGQIHVVTGSAIFKVTSQRKS